MKKDLPFWILFLSAVVLFAADIVLAAVYAASALSFINGGALLPSSGFLPLSIVLIILNSLLAVSAAGYFVFRKIRDSR